MKSSTWKLLATKRMGLSFLMGFTSGLPLLTIGSTLQAWMTDFKVDLKLIGFFSLVGLPYTLKFLWSPFVDRYSLGSFGRRRGWMLASQIGLMVSFIALSGLDPATQLTAVAALALCISFLSATQDIVVDAYRREALQDNELALGVSLYVNGYRIAMLVSGALALFLADRVAWPLVYQFFALCMGLGVLTTLWADEPKGQGIAAPKTLTAAVIDPFVEFLRRPSAFWILAFILFYKLGDNLAGQMSTPFFLAIGFTKTEIAAVAKIFGMGATILGGLLGGVLLLRMELYRALVVFGILQLVTTVAFSLLHWTGPSSPMLALLMTLENLSGGMGTSAFLAYMGSMTNKQFTATQYALLSSLMGVPRVILAAPTGVMAVALGWPLFFIFCGAMALPGLAILAKFRRDQNREKKGASR